MEVLIRGNKVEITESMSNYVKEKMSKLDKYMDTESLKANVLVKVRNYTQKIEVTIPGREKGFFSKIKSIFKK